MTAAADWKLHSRTGVSLQSAPVQAAALASLNLDGLGLQEKSAEELCQLKAQPRVKPIMAALEVA